MYHPEHVTRTFSTRRSTGPIPHHSFSLSEFMDPPRLLICSTYRWNDADWQGLPLDDYIIYEVHVGTYTTEGTFAGIIPYLPELKSLGVTALELMPVAQFPGDRNWGYDGVYPFAVQNSYGGPAGMQMLVDACHAHGMAVVLDVVYNHLGPEGNYLGDFGPYFTDRYRSPWGQAINFDGPESDEVVRFFIENALHWVRDFHIDALRLDAIHGIVDCNAQPFLRLLAEAVHEFAGQSGTQDLSDCRERPERCALHPTGDRPEGTDWMRNGATTFITLCTRCSRAKPRVTTWILAGLGT